MGSPAFGAGNIDPNAVGGGGGGDPNAGGFDTSNAGDPNAFDPSTGGFFGDPSMGGGVGGDMSGGGRGPDTSAASVANTQLQAPYDIQAGGGLRAPGGGPATDQPRTYQNAGEALMGGHQQTANLGGPPIREPTTPTYPEPSDPGVFDFSSHGGMPDSPRAMEPWAPLPNTNLGAPDSFSSRFGASQPDASFAERFNAAQPSGATRGVNLPPPATPDGSRPYPPESNVGGLPAIPRPYSESNVGGLPAIPPRPSTSVPTPQPANIPTPQSRPSPGVDLQAAAAPPATPPAASPAATTTGRTPGMGGGAPQSPLEQIIGQFLQMLGIGGGGGGGILSPLEHMLARALGINLQPYPGFNPGFHSPFFPQPGPGQFPAGVVGGRRRSSDTFPLELPYAATGDGQPHENHPDAPDGTQSPGARQAGAGGPNTTGVPDDVLRQARQWATKGPGAVYQFMKENGHPRSGAWCGEFAAAVMQHQGLPVPDHPEIASNWRKWGIPTNNPKPGDIAVNKISYMRPHGEVPIGGRGSHVSTVTNVDPVRGEITLVGGNQRGFTPIIIHRNQLKNWDIRTLGI